MWPSAKKVFKGRESTFFEFSQSPRITVKLGKCWTEWRRKIWFLSSKDLFPLTRELGISPGLIPIPSLSIHRQFRSPNSTSESNWKSQPHIQIPLKSRVLGAVGFSFFKALQVILTDSLCWELMHHAFKCSKLSATRQLRPFSISPAFLPKSATFSF